jgi:hypothetical protein
MQQQQTINPFNPKQVGVARLDMKSIREKKAEIKKKGEKEGQ